MLIGCLITNATTTTWLKQNSLKFISFMYINLSLFHRTEKKNCLSQLFVTTWRWTAKPETNLSKKEISLNNTVLFHKLTTNVYKSGVINTLSRNKDIKNLIETYTNIHIFCLSLSHSLSHTQIKYVSRKAEILLSACWWFVTLEHLLTLLQVKQLGKNIKKLLHYTHTQKKLTSQLVCSLYYMSRNILFKVNWREEINSTQICRKTYLTKEFSNE